MTTIVNPDLRTHLSTPALTGPSLARVAGLPANVLHLVSESTRILLDRAAALRTELKGAQEATEDALFALVPQLDDDVPLRRRVLAGKRKVHQGSNFGWQPAELVAVTGRMGEGPSEPIRRWHRLTSDLEQCQGQLAASIAADRQAGVQRLFAATEDERYRRSLTLAAPDWLRHGVRDRDSAGSIRTALLYAQRAAVKASPFSGLTTVGVAGRAGRGAATSHASDLLAILALRRLASDPVSARGLRFRTVAVRTGMGGDELAVVPELVHASGIVWRDDHVMTALNLLRWTEAMANDDGSTLTYQQVLDRLGGADPESRYLRLLEAGVLVPELPWRRGDDPFPALADTIVNTPRTDGPVPAGSISRLGELGHRIAQASVDERLQAQTQAARLVGEWVEPEDDHQHVVSGWFYEDRETDLHPGDPLRDERVRSALEGLGRHARPFIFRSHVYDFLVAEFVAAYGIGGRCRDPLTFFMELAVELDMPRHQSAEIADMRYRGTAGERAWLPVGPTSAPPAVTSLVQPCRDDDLVAVVNNYSAGSGGLFARFVRLLGDDFADAMRDHVAACWPAAGRHLELVAWADCNSAQAKCVGLLPALDLPGEPRRAGGIALSDLDLVHDPATDTLSLVDRDSSPVGLAYLGLVPHHLLQGYLRLLAVLADPWVNGSTSSDYTMHRMSELRPLLSAEVVHLDREVVAGLVTRRESWLVPVDTLPQAGRDDLQCVQDWHGFRTAHGIPEEVFVHQLGAFGSPSQGLQKPLWVNLDSVLSVGVLRTWLSGSTTHIRVVEALPDTTGHHVIDHDGQARAAEFAVLLRWPRPEGH